MTTSVPATDVARYGRHGHLLLPPLVLALVAGAGTLGLASWDPHVHHVPLCPLHAATGVWCPLCGGLRAVNDLTAWHWAAALSDNALVVVLAPVVVAWWAAWTRRAVSGRPGTHVLGLSANQRRLVWSAAGVLLVAYTVVRNLPVGAVLAPAR